MSDRNKIAQELTVEQLDQFISGLAELPGKQRTLAAIQERAFALNIQISLMSAKSFRELIRVNSGETGFHQLAEQREPERDRDEADWWKHG